MTMLDRTPFERVHAYFAGDAALLAEIALRSYYGAGYHYTGAAFDRWAIAGSSPNRFTTDDVVAVSMLSVAVPPRAALALLDDPHIAALLESVECGETLWSKPSLLDDNGPAEQLWYAVRALDDVGPVTTSKLLAAKRPGLVPIYDQHVASALGLGTQAWRFWQQVAKDPGAAQLRRSIDGVALSAGVPQGVSTLRVIDVVVWMCAYGWTQHDSEKCGLGCELERHFSRARSHDDK